MILADTHSHLYDEAFDGDRAETVARALDAGVSTIMLPAIDSASHGALFAACRDYPGTCRAMMGLHPTSVNDNPAWREELTLVEKYLAEPPAGIKFHGVGEVGLDLYWSRDYLPQQTEAFERQIELSLLHGLPLAIHTRSAWEEMLNVLGKYKGQGLKGVMHAFSGNYQDYEAVKGLGDFLFGIAGVVTYKNSFLAEVVARMPLEDMVLETDAPYLTPVPFRGKRNESAYIPYICNKVAEVTGKTPDAVARQTTANAARLFGLSV